MQMDPRVKELWLEALRSGEYKQGKGRLARVAPDGSKNYCCLGVLCEIAVREGVIPPGEEKTMYHADGGVASVYLRFEEGSAYPPESVAHWAGFGGHTNPPLPKPVTVGDDLAADSMFAGTRLDGLDQLNDSGVSFSAIADIIEEQL